MEFLEIATAREQSQNNPYDERVDLGRIVSDSKREVGNKSDNPTFPPHSSSSDIRSNLILDLKFDNDFEYDQVVKRSLMDLCKLSDVCRRRLFVDSYRRHVLQKYFDVCEEMYFGKWNSYDELIYHLVASAPQDSTHGERLSPPYGDLYPESTTRQKWIILEDKYYLFSLLKSLKLRQEKQSNDVFFQSAQFCSLRVDDEHDRLPISNRLENSYSVIQKLDPSSASDARARRRQMRESKFKRSKGDSETNPGTDGKDRRGDLRSDTGEPKESGAADSETYLAVTPAFTEPESKRRKVIDETRYDEATTEPMTLDTEESGVYICPSSSSNTDDASMGKLDDNNEVSYAKKSRILDSSGGEPLDASKDDMKCVNGHDPISQESVIVIETDDEESSKCGEDGPAGMTTAESAGGYGLAKIEVSGGKLLDPQISNHVHAREGSENQTLKKAESLPNDNAKSNCVSQQDGKKDLKKNSKNIIRKGSESNPSIAKNDDKIVKRSTRNIESSRRVTRKPSANLNNSLKFSGPLTNSKNQIELPTAAHPQRCIILKDEVNFTNGLKDPIEVVSGRKVSLPLYRGETESRHSPSFVDFLRSKLRRNSVCDYWSPKEVALFEAVICQRGKDFHCISETIETKASKECVDFYYYLWKHTDRYRSWKHHRLFLKSYLSRGSYADL